MLSHSCAEPVVGNVTSRSLEKDDHPGKTVGALIPAQTLLLKMLLHNQLEEVIRLVRQREYSPALVQTLVLEMLSTLRCLVK